MQIVLRLIAGLLLSALLPLSAQAAEDPFLGTWQLDIGKSIIAENPGVKSKQFVFAPSAEGVLITETLELLAEPGKKQVAEIPYTYGKATPRPSPASTFSLNKVVGVRERRS